MFNKSKVGEIVIPFSFEEKLLGAMSIATLIVGFYVGYKCSPDWFERISALLICYAVYFGASGYSEKLSKLEEIAMEELDEIDNAVASIPIQGGNEGVIRQIKEKNYNQRNAISRSVFAAKSRILMVEAYVAIAGTLAWAFGSKIYLLVQSSHLCA